MATTTTRKRTYTRRVSRDEIFRIRVNSFVAGVFATPIGIAAWPIISTLFVR